MELFAVFGLSETGIKKATHMSPPLAGAERRTSFWGDRLKARQGSARRALGTSSAAQARFYVFLCDPTKSWHVFQPRPAGGSYGSPF